MICFTPRPGTTLLAVALTLLIAAPAPAGDFQSQTTLGASFFFASPPCPVKKFPAFEQLVPIPNVIDPFDDDLVPIFCDVQVSREGERVKNAKGKFESELILLDNDTGMVTRQTVASGTFKTDKDGQSTLDFDIPTELFADGFESGDVSAWSYTRTDFTNRKRASDASAFCQSLGSRSK